MPRLHNVFYMNRGIFEVLNKLKGMAGYEEMTLVELVHELRLTHPKLFRLKPTARRILAMAPSDKQINYLAKRYRVAKAKFKEYVRVCQVVEPISLTERQLERIDPDSFRIQKVREKRNLKGEAAIQKTLNQLLEEANETGTVVIRKDLLKI